MLPEEDLTHVDEISFLSVSPAPPPPVQGRDLDPDERQIGPYRVHARVAAGGMASVYLVCREGPAGWKQVVACKRMHAHLAKRPEYVEMFRDEVRLASRVIHPYVAPVIDYGEAQGRPYMVMEYVPGESLSRVMARLCERPTLTADPRFPHIVARIIANLCEALHAAHEAVDDEGNPLGLVHRDVNPPNLFVAYDGSVRLIDFGVATALRRQHHTGTGILKGKVSYMAPEAFRREALDRRADVWSMGVVAWEMLTGRRLFRRASEVETIGAICAHDVPDPATINPVVPPELSAVVASALGPDRNERPPTARALGSALEALLAEWNDAVPATDFASWLKDLCPGAHERHKQLLTWVRQEHDRCARADEESGPQDSDPTEWSVVRTPARTPEPLRVAAPPPRLPPGFWRTLTMAACLEVVVVLLLAGAALQGRTDRLRAHVPQMPGTALSASALALSPGPPTVSRTPMLTSAWPTFVGPRAPDPADPPAAPPPSPPRRVAHRSQEVAHPRPAAVDPAPMAVPEKGQVFVSTPGATAQVKFEDQVVGRTPCYVVLPAGPQRLTLSYAGQALPVDVQVPARGLVTVHATLTR